MLFLSQCIQAQQLRRRPFFGANLLDVTKAQKKELKLPSIKGVYLARVLPHSSAAEARFKAGDVLVGLNNQAITSVKQFVPLIKTFETGDQIQLTFYRAGKKQVKSLVFKGFPYKQSDRYEVVYGSVKAQKNHLRTIITKPKKEGKFPAVVIIQGVGCINLDHPAVDFYHVLADSLTSKDMVVMQIEKTGQGDSKGTPCRECTFDEEVEGYRQGLLALKKLPYVNADQIFLFGFSMGGVIAPILANIIPVKGIIAYGTVGRNWSEYSMENSRRQAEMAGTEYDKIATRMRRKARALHYMMLEQMPKKQLIAQHPELARNVNFYPQSYRYFQKVGSLNLAKYWIKAGTNVLVIHGKADFVSFAKDHQLIAQIVNRESPGKATHLELANSDHWLHNVSTMQESLQNIRAPKNVAKNYQLYAIASRWIQDVLGKKPLSVKD